MKKRLPIIALASVLAGSLLASLMSCQYTPRVLVEGHASRLRFDSLCILRLSTAYGDTVDIATLPQLYIDHPAGWYFVAEVGRDSILSYRRCLTPSNYFERDTGQWPKPAPFIADTCEEIAAPTVVEPVRPHYDISTVIRKH